jgi:hypothetical protein
MHLHRDGLPDTGLRQRILPDIYAPIAKLKIEHHKTGCPVPVSGDGIPRHSQQPRHPDQAEGICFLMRNAKSRGFAQ